MAETAYVLETGRSHRCRHLGLLEPHCLGSREMVLEAVRRLRGRTLWIAMSLEPVYWLAGALAESPASPHGFLLVLAEVPAQLGAVLAARFERFVPRPGSLLPLDELATVLARQDRADFCVGGTVVEKAGLVVLVRGDLTFLTVPLADFAGRPGGALPDFGRFEVADHGRTLRFGTFEAAFDAVLYERDAAFRKRVKKRRLAQDESLGGALRRLRLQRGLRLADMGPLEKTVARLERGEVRAPRKSTLAVIAKKLGVDPEQIRQF